MTARCGRAQSFISGAFGPSDFRGSLATFDPARAELLASDDVAGAAEVDYTVAVALWRPLVGQSRSTGGQFFGDVLDGWRDDGDELRLAAAAVGIRAG
jgi:hypothetical protein